ncbi:MAG: hypothetical protein CO094_10715 [Anaerolineae bacterium CG_4_9_14_3_um_filter_57_17]|nr:MAG: hypothetical protein AUK01_11705 [Anaerolineae bacterium CG2_30_57_67]PJB65167.1 MAG: hypothetical protein CO094_10715 [Anaerolineae bacterium CG_4_9_14_3_um_filter_57_17]
MKIWLMCKELQATRLGRSKSKNLNANFPNEANNAKKNCVIRIERVWLIAQSLHMSHSLFMKIII